MLTPALVALLAAASPGASQLKLDAPATDALMLLARQTSLDLFAPPLTGRVKGEFAIEPKEALVRNVLAQVPGKPQRRGTFVFVGRPTSIRSVDLVDIGRGSRIESLWEREISAGELARLLGLALRRQVQVAAPHDREVLTVVLSDVPAEEAVAALAFYLGQPVHAEKTGPVSIGTPDAAATRECKEFSMSEWTRLSGYAPSPYPLALLQTGGASCPTQVGRSVRTADGDLLRALGPDQGAVAMMYRWVSGEKAGTFVRVSFDDYQEVRPCSDVTRDSKLKRASARGGFAILVQGLVECAVTRNVSAGEFKILEVDAKGPYVLNTSKGAKSAVVQVTTEGLVGAVAPVARP